jgi:hypothetical protein
MTFANGSRQESVMATKRQLIIQTSDLKLAGNHNQPRKTVAGGFDWTAKLAAGIETLDTRTDELLAFAKHAAKANARRGDEIDSMLAKIREVRATAAAA